MPSEVTKKDVWQIAETLMEADTIPTVVSVRSRLGGGNPHTIASHLASWREVHTQEKILFYTEREAMMAVQEEMERERLDLMEEIERLDHALDGARKELSTGAHALDVERKAHERAKTQNKAQQQQIEEARENAKKLTEQNRALQIERKTFEEKTHPGKELDIRFEKLQAALTGGKQAGGADRGEAEKLAQQNQALKIELATLKEQAIHADALKALIEKLRAEIASLSASLSAGLAAGKKADPTSTTDKMAAEKLAQQNQALKVEVATLKERAIHADAFKTLVEKLQGELASLAKRAEPEKTDTKAAAPPPTSAPTPAPAPSSAQAPKGAPGAKPTRKN